MALGDYTPVALGIAPPAAPKPFDLGGTLKTVSEIQSNQAYAQNMQSEIKARNFETFQQRLSSAAQDIIQQPDGVAKAQRWEDHVKSLSNDYPDFISPSTRDYYLKSGPSDIILHQAMGSGSNLATFGTVSGQTAGNDARATAPYAAHPMDPNIPFGYPAMLPGAPNTGLWGGPASRGAIPPAMGSAPPVGGSPGAPAPRAAVPGAPTANVDGSDTSVSNKSNPYYQSAPVQQVGRTLPKGPGIVNQGVDPAAVQAREEGLKEFGEISDTAQAATKTQGELGSMESELRSGKVSSNRLADLKQTIAGYMYGVSNQSDAAVADIQKTLGINLPWSEVFKKDSTRMGLTFARQTEGAREAVAAIKIALGANPDLMNSAQGNLKIIQIMDQGAKYDIERSKAAQGYLNKQQDATGTPHLVGFDNWIAATNPPGKFISKAVPYQVPTLKSGAPDESQLKDGYTYENLPKHPGVTGVYDAQHRHFNPVAQ